MKLAPILFARELPDVLGDLLAMPVQRDACATVRPLRLTASRYAVSGTFASTTSDRPAGSRTIMSGTNSHAVAFARLLFGKIAIVHHAGQLRDAPQRNFAPTAAGLRRSQSGGKRGCLARQRLQLLAQAADKLSRAHAPARGRELPSGPANRPEADHASDSAFDRGLLLRQVARHLARAMVSSVVRAASRNAL